MRAFRNTLLLSLLASPLTPTSHADTLFLKDGRSFSGVITENNPDRVAIDTLVGAIRTTLHFPRRDVDRLILEKLPENFFTPPARDASTSPDTSSPSPAGEPPAPPTTPDRPPYFLEFPLEGILGEDCIPKSLEDTLAFAVSRHIDDVILHINTSGGPLWAADDFVRIIQRFDPQLRIHAWVSEATAAALPIALACDTIHMRPSAIIGAAVPPKDSKPHPANDAIAKAGSAYAASVTAVAESKGRNPALARAMVTPSACLYYWTLDSGETRISDHIPEDTTGITVRTADGPDSILTLTGAEAVRLGLANNLADSTDDIASSLGRAPWREPVAHGRALVDRYAAKRRELHTLLPSQLDRIDAGLKDAEASNPHKHTYYEHDEASGEFTEAARKLWVSRTDSSIAAWRRIRTDVEELERLARESRNLAIPLHALGLSDERYSRCRELAVRADRELEKLKREKNRKNL